MVKNSVFSGFICHGSGEESTRLIIAEGRRAAEGLQGAKKAELQRACDEVEFLTNQLSDLCHRGMVCHFKDPSLTSK